MLIGWVNDYTSFDHRPGGAQRATDLYRKTAPEGVEIVPCNPGNVARDCDAYILFLTKHFSDDELQFLANTSYIRCGYDWWHAYEPQARWRNALTINAQANVWVSPLHKSHFIDRNRLSLDPRRQHVIPPPMEPEIELLRRLDHNGRAYWAAEWHPYKGPDLAARWALKNGVPLDMFCPAYDVTAERQLNRFCYVHPFLADNERLEKWSHYDRFLHFNRYPDAFGYAILEAFLLGVNVTISGYTGVESFGMPFDQLAEVCYRAPEQFWKLVEQTFS